MLFLREIIAFLQLTVIPALAVVGALRPRLGGRRTVLLLPFLSLPVNYLFVASAFAFGVFLPPVSALYSAVLWLAAVWFWRAELKQFLLAPPEIGEYAAAGFRHITGWFDSLDRGGRVLLAAALGGSALAVAFYLGWLWDGVDNIFSRWDSALSWNVWAESWAQGKFPAGVAEYPQLLPMNWALAYQLIGEPVQFVPKAAVSLFPLLTLLLFLGEGIARKNTAMLLGVPILGFYFANVGYLEHGGELDLLIAGYPAAIFVILLCAKEAPSGGVMLRQLAPAALLTAAAAVTKQAGAYLLAAVPILAWVMLRERFSAAGWSRRRAAVGMAVAVTLCLLLVAPYYAVATARIRSGRSVSKIPLVTHSIYGGKSYSDRFLCSARLFMLTLQGGIRHIPSARWAQLDKSGGIWRTVRKLYGRHLAAGILLLLLNMLLLACAVREPGCRTVAALTLIYFLIWSIFFCYDLRNLSLAMPGLAMLAALGMVRLERSRGWTGCRRITLLILCAALFAALHPESFLSGSRRARFRSAMMEAGSPGLNRKLLEYCREKDFRRGIITDYEYIRILPGAEKLYRHADLSLNDETVLRRYRELLADPETGGILLPSYAMDAVARDVKEREKNGELTAVFSMDEYTFYVRSSGAKAR